MTIIHLSYAQINEYWDPNVVLKKLDFYSGILEGMTKYAAIKSIHCISYTGVLTKNGVEYHFLKRKKWQHWFPFSLHIYIKKLRPDAIIVHGLIFPWQVVLLRCQLGIGVKIIAQHHAERPFYDIRRFLQRWTDRYISAYLFCSFELGQRWVDGRQISNSKKIKEIMEASSHFLPIEKQQARSVTKVVGERIFLWVGRLDANKDPLIVARAFARFASLNPHVSLYMIFRSVELLDELKLIVMNTRSSDIIHLVGKIEHDELIYWYNSADFIMSSSHYEGSGVAVCEGLSCGCIPILTNIPSFKMMTDNGRIGMLFEPGKDDSLVVALQKTQGMNLEHEKEKVLDRFRNVLSFDAISKKIMDVVYEVK